MPGSIRLDYGLIGEEEKTEKRPAREAMGEREKLNVRDERERKEVIKLELYQKEKREDRRKELLVIDVGCRDMRNPVNVIRKMIELDD